MNSSPAINDIVAALCKAQSQMAAAKKDSTNPHFNSKYADLAAIVEAILSARAWYEGHPELALDELEHRARALAKEA